RLDRCASLLDEGVVQGAFPGAVALVTRCGRVALQVAVGHLWPNGPLAEPGTLFDLASMTKPLATAGLCLALWELGRLHLQDEARHFFPDRSLPHLKGVSLHHLLTHTSGLPPAARACREPLRSREAVLNILEREPAPPRGQRYCYTDLGYTLAGEIIERASGEPLDAAARRLLFEPLAMPQTGFWRTHGGGDPEAGALDAEASSR